MKATWSTFNLKKVMFHTPDVAYMHLQDLKKVICLFIGHIKTHVHSLKRYRANINNSHLKRKLLKNYILHFSYILMCN